MIKKHNSKWDRDELYLLIKGVHDEVGDRPFLDLSLLPLEKLIRTKLINHGLPGKTLFREEINKYRAKTWPNSGYEPKKIFRI